MEQFADGTLARHRFLLLLFGIFAGLALLLACDRHLWRAGLPDQPARAGNRCSHGAGRHGRRCPAAGAPPEPGNDSCRRRRGHRCRLGSGARVAAPGGRNAAHRAIDFRHHDFRPGGRRPVREFCSGPPRQPCGSAERPSPGIKSNAETAKGPWRNCPAPIVIPALLATSTALPPAGAPAGAILLAPDFWPRSASDPDEALPGSRRPLRTCRPGRGWCRFVYFAGGTTAVNSGCRWTVLPAAT